MERCGKMDEDMPGTRSPHETVSPRGLLLPSGQVIMMSGLWDRGGFMRNTHSAEQSEHELFWGNLAAFYHLSFVMMRNSIHYSIRKDWNDMNLGTKGNNDSSDKKISTSNICLLNNQRWQGTKKKSMASVKLIIMPQQTLNCSSSVSAAAMSNTVRINIHYSCLSLFVSPSHGWRLFMRMLCVSLLTPDLRGWPSSQGVSVRGKKRVE